MHGCSARIEIKFGMNESRMCQFGMEHFARERTQLSIFCMPDEARDGHNVALIDKCFMVCSIVQRRIKLLSTQLVRILYCMNSNVQTTF